MHYTLIKNIYTIWIHADNSPIYTLDYSMKQTVESEPGSINDYVIFNKEILCL